ncbi:MAG: outer membrane beta-barrel protein [Cucumibacter sp.]
MLKKLALAAVAALGLSTSAQAADWTGFYLGVLGGVSFGGIPDCRPSCNEAWPGIAKVVGYNWDNGDVIFGIDEMVVVTFVPEEFTSDPVRKVSWQKMARIGFEITDNVMLYGAVGGGYGVIWDDEGSASAWYGAVAGGAEVALNEDLIWRTHLQYSRSQNFSDCTGCYVRVLTWGTGLVWSLN